MTEHPVLLATVLTAEDASIVAEDMGYNVIVDNEKAFDILPE
jgi:hypothetical protein